MLVMIGTDYIGSCKSNYHTTTTTTAPPNFVYDFLSAGIWYHRHDGWDLWFTCS